MRVVAVLAGRFHPFHRGHKASYDYLARKYGTKNVYVVSTNTQAPMTSPFSFTDKQQMMIALGVPASHIVQVKNPYSPVEVTAGLDADNTSIVFAVSEKDADRFSFKPKRDGSPAYLQPMRDSIELAPLRDHGYVEVAPTVEFKVLGQSATSASEIRKLYLNADEETRESIITDLYGSFDPKIKNIFDKALHVTEAYGVMATAHSRNLLESIQADQFRSRLQRALEQERKAHNEFKYGRK